MNQIPRLMKKIVFISIKYLIPVILLPFLLLSKEQQLNCKISDEIENGEITTRRVYKNYSLRIYVDTKFNWINDISYIDFKENTEIFNSSTISYKKEKKKINFKMTQFFTEEKKLKNIVSDINYDIEKGLINYRKIYFDFDGNNFFSTTVKGICHKISN